MRTCHNIERSKLEPKFKPNPCASESALEKQPVLNGSLVGVSTQRLKTKLPRTTEWHSEQPHGQPARKKNWGDDRPLGSFLRVWSYTSLSFHLTLDLGRLWRPVPATLGCPLEHAVEGSKSVPRQEDIGQLRFYETLRDLENGCTSSSGTCGVCGGLTHGTEPIAILRMEWFVALDPDVARWDYDLLDGVWRERLDL